MWARAWLLSPRARSLCAAERATRARSSRSLACYVAVAFSAARMASSASETSLLATFGPLDAQPVARGMQTTRAARVTAVVTASRAELLFVFKEDLLYTGTTRWREECNSCRIIPAVVRSNRRARPRGRAR